VTGTEAKSDKLPPLPPLPPAKHVGAGARLRNYFLTGVIIAGPLAVTAYITWSAVTWVDGWVKPFVPSAYNPDTYLPFRIPGFGLIIAILGLTTLGFLTANLVGRSLLDLGEMALERMPVVRSLYRIFKQIFETVFSQSNSTFRKVGLVEFPGPRMWSIVFISVPPSNQIGDKLPSEDEFISVFLPCTPNPTTGFYFYLPRKDIIELSISVDEAAKLIMSAGLIQPGDQQRKLQALADRAKAVS
jgi:uncharacterized membrane protein